MDFVAGGKLGDFIHSLYVVKNLCQLNGEKANLYLSADGDVWRLGVERAFEDLSPIISAQPYIADFKLLPDGFSNPLINLNKWRTVVADVHARTGRYIDCWSDVLSKTYGFPIPADYAWLSALGDPQTAGKLVIHRSLRHHGELRWPKQIGHTARQNVLFVTSDLQEWESFPCRNMATLYLVQTSCDIINAIASCRMFIGNQSAPFAIASALDVPRLVELSSDPACFYMGETKYSDKISWYLNEGTQYKCCLNGEER